MEFVSTRGGVRCGFIEAFLQGLANDGGLFVPAHVPKVSKDELKSWRGLSYQELFLKIAAPFVGDEIPEQDLKKLVHDSYSTFRSPEVTPVQPIADGLYVLELFHGPTFAFKDVALQFMGNLYAYVSQKYGEKIHIIGATSGDTGAAAIHGVKSKEGIKICILHPHGKVSKVQELQMTSLLDDNVLNLSVRGNFDDCQQIVKELFSDVAFKSEHSLRAVNSINFVRILAQTVYYFYAYFKVADDSMTEEIHFSVPTGNFGDIFAGYLARLMGLPAGKFLLATNENNILERFVNDGVYRPENFKTTYSPAMDIQIASNFERYLYYLHGEDGTAVTRIMNDFREKGLIAAEGDTLRRVQSDFASYAVSNAACLETIKDYNERHGYLLDPHTACGVAAYERTFKNGGGKCVALATAHPAKFDEAIAECGIRQTFPEPIAELWDKPQRMTVVDSDKQQVIEQLLAFFK